MDEKLNQSQSQEFEQRETRQQKKEAGEQQPGKGCRHCGAANPPDAMFCAECGAGLGSDQFCPNCGEKTHLNGDICEACGHWLLEGKCKFCYAELEDGQQFCAECGNPAGGITCHNCGTLSNFDYCPKCFTPLTESAAELLAQMKKDPAEREFLETRQNVAALDLQIAQMEAELEAEIAAPPPSPDIPEETDPPEIESLPPDDEPGADLAEKRREKMRLMSQLLDEQLSQEAAEKQRREALARQQEMERKKVEAEKRRAEQNRKKAEAQTRRAEEQQKLQAEQKKRETKIQKIAELKKKQKAEARKLTEQYKDMKHKRFTNNQMARNYFMAHRPPTYVGWVCNFMNGEVLHPDPHNCADPWKGGVWVFEWDGITDPNEIKWERGTGW